jgi:hypothetical protein
MPIWSGVRLFFKAILTLKRDIITLLIRSDLEIIEASAKIIESNVLLLHSREIFVFYFF